MTPDYQTPERMAQKREAIPLPDLEGKSVLDVGCDTRYWCDLALKLGASRVVGIDRGRVMRDGEFINLADHTMDLGKQYHNLGQFDVIFMFSMYHHAFQSAGDHLPIWYWLWRHMKPWGELLWENPVSTDDPVVKKDVAEDYQSYYSWEEIRFAASYFFKREYIGSAIHSPTREVYRFLPKTKAIPVRSRKGVVVNGAGGATKAFLYNDGRRGLEIQTTLGVYPFPGSLNVMCDELFWYGMWYYRAQISDVKDRRAGLDSEWGPRWARFYPVSVNGLDAWAFRFEGETYPDNFVELISQDRLRDKLQSEVTLYGR